MRLRDSGRWYWHWDPKFLDRRHPHDEVASKEISPAAARIKIPTLLVRGGSSDRVSIEGLQYFLKLVSHAEFVDVKDAGHMVAGDKNDAFTDGIVEFLDRNFEVKE